MIARTGMCGIHLRDSVAERSLARVTVLPFCYNGVESVSRWFRNEPLLSQSQRLSNYYYVEWFPGREPQVWYLRNEIYMSTKRTAVGSATEPWFELGVPGVGP